MLKKRGSSLNKRIVAGGVGKVLPCAFMAPGFGPDMTDMTDMKRQRRVYGDLFREAVG
jgi:hypothetical protein